LRRQYIANGAKTVKRNSYGTILIFKSFLSRGTLAFSSLDKLVYATLGVTRTESLRG